MGDSDKRPLIWLPQEILSSDSEINIKGKQKSTSDSVPVVQNGFNMTNYDVRIPIGSASSPLNEEVVVSREEFKKVWTPEAPLVHDDRIRRSSLWDSAMDLGNNLKTSSKDLGIITNEKVGEGSEDKICGEINVCSKLEDDIKAIDKQPTLLLKSTIDSFRQVTLDLPSVTSINYHEVEKLSKSNSIKAEMKEWVQKSDKRKNSMSERLFELLKPRRAHDDNVVPLVQDTSLEKKISNATEVSQLNHMLVEKKKSIVERMPPEWVVLLLGCLLGLSSGISVVVFNKGVHFIHDMVWAGIPDEGASWLRKQKLVDVWHQILMVPVVGGVVVGMFHTVTDILEVVRANQHQSPLPSRSNKIDWLAALKQVIKAFQAALTLGTGSSLGPEGPSVDIGKSWAHGFSNIMKNSKERRIALVAAGAAAGIASGFSAPVAGTFFAIETVLKPQHAENSPPLTTAMIILAAVISSTISEILLDERPAFTVPPYELRSAAELPLYILLGGICGIMSVTFTRLVAWFTRAFDFLKHQLGVPPSVTPAIGAFLTGIIALQYPGVLYWGFTNVDEILKTGFTTTAPGKGLLTQLTIAKVVATAMCKGSGLVGGLYAPSLFIGSAVGGVYGSIIGEAINKVIPSGNGVAHPQAYALVGMAALLASMCSVPMTSVLLLFELTKDYRILLPLMGAVGLAIWVAALGRKSQCTSKTANPQAGFARPPSDAAAPSGCMWRLRTAWSGAFSTHRGVWSLLSGESAAGLEVVPSGRVWRKLEGPGLEIELVTLGSDDDPNAIYISQELLMNECRAADAMLVDFVRVNAMSTVKESLGAMLVGGQCCALVVDENDLLEGIMSSTDLQREVLRAIEESIYSNIPIIIETDTMLVAAICTSNMESGSSGQNIVVCYPDTSLHDAEELMKSHSLVQLPVVTRFGRQWQDRNNKVVGVLHREVIPQCIKIEASKRMAILLAQKAKDEDFSPVSEGTH